LRGQGQAGRMNFKVDYLRGFRLIFDSEGFFKRMIKFGTVYPPNS
jgi:hypothetical protein